MLLKDTPNQMLFKDTLEQFTSVNYDKYNTHAFNAGYMQSMLVEMLAHVPKKMQQQYLSQIKSHVERNLVTTAA